MAAIATAIATAIGYCQDAGFFVIIGKHRETSECLYTFGVTEVTAAVMW